MIERLRLWFTGRSLREQRMLLVMVALAALTFVWAGIIWPVTDGLSSARERHADALIRLAETQARMKEVESLQRQRPAPLEAQLDTVIRDRANEAGFALASVTADGPNRVQITIATARPGPLFGWIAGLESAGILVDSLSTADNGDKTVSAQLSLKVRGQ
ncbi:MAG: type II secretion system protein GspM [Candidatus Sphingomonas phytovorans]|nr:type II secretion system protein GspM [Sphingomonas sp.]WEK01613.1 MAG: type II secretion system protein GspM [Sphingomonas sp.]